MSSLQEKTEKLIVYGKSQLSSKGVESTATTIRGVLDDVANIQTGGVAGSGQYLVQVVDYDGTVLKSDHLNTGDTFTLPEAPTHDKLVFQGWSSPYDIVDNKVTVDNQDITIGPMYTTASGLSEFDITLTKVTGLTVTFNMVGNKNWGDGTSNSETTHTYVNYGNYTITCDGTELPAYIMGQSDSAINYTLTDVRFGGSVTGIGSMAFYYCFSLTSITIPSSVAIIESHAFNNCTSLGSISIPASVTSIGSSVFTYCTSLKSVTIPASVTSINDYAFNDCTSLSSISIPNGVTHIYSGAFTGCTSLSSISMPRSITFISSEAFSRCFSITKYDFSTAITVPTLSDTNVFNSINGICKIIVPDALYDEWIAATNWTTYADYIYKVSEVYPPEPTPEPTPANYFNISNGTINGFSTQGKQLYDAGELTELVLPSSYSCGEEQEVTTVFETYDSLDLFMFENEFYPVTVQVGSLSQMFVFNNFDEFSDNYEQLYDESNFLVTYRFIPIIDGNDYAVTSIGIAAFSGCSGLTSITIPKGVTSIGNSTFANCSSLTSITIPKGVTSIGNSTFANCSSLISIVVDLENTTYDSRNNCNAIIETDTNTLISGCKNTVIPTTVTSIASSAFFGCSSLTSITIPKGVTSIGNSTFANCSSLISIDLSNASNLTNIGDSAFSGCRNLTSITIPSSVTSIGAYTFQDCSSLTSITIPSGVTSIGDSAFYSCSSLTSITIPSSVTSIEGNAFNGCSSLTEMTILSTVPPTLSNTNAISSVTTTIYIPAGTLSAYQTATNWSNFASKFVELSE